MPQMVPYYDTFPYFVTLKGVYHNGRRVVTGAARNTYRLNNEHIAHAEYAYDDGAWDSWYGNGGDIHNAERFIIGGTGSSAEFSVNIDGKPQIPCFNAQDIAAGDATGRAQAAECRKEMDKYLGY